MEISKDRSGENCTRFTTFDLNTGKSMEISKNGSLDKTLLYLWKLTLTLW